MATAQVEGSALVEVLDQVSSDLDLTSEQLARVLGVSVATLEGWRRHEFVPSGKPAARLKQLRALDDHLRDTFASPGAIPEYLRSSVRYLGGDTPLDALLAGEIERVEGALDALDSGIFV